MFLKRLILYLLPVILCAFVAGAAFAVPTFYTVEADYLADLSGYTTVSEGFEGGV